MAFNLLKGLKKPYREYGGLTNTTVKQPTDRSGQTFSATRYGSTADKSKAGYAGGTSFNKIPDHPVSLTPTHNGNAKPLAHPVSRPNAKPLTHPVSSRYANGGAAGRVSDENRNVAKSLAHPSSARTRNGEPVGRVSDENRSLAKSLAHPQSYRGTGGGAVGRVSDENSRARVETIRPKPPSAKLITTRTGGKTKTVAGKPVAVSTRSEIGPRARPAAAAAKEGFGARFKKALKRSKQTNKIKALQRQHKAARKG